MRVLGDEILNSQDPAEPQPRRTSKRAATRNPTAWSRIFFLSNPIFGPLEDLELQIYVKCTKCGALSVRNRMRAREPVEAQVKLLNTK